MKMGKKSPIISFRGKVNVEIQNSSAFYCEDEEIFGMKKIIELEKLCNWNELKMYGKTGGGKLWKIDNKWQQTKR